MVFLLVLVALGALLIVGVGAAVLAHVERVEQVVHDIAEAGLLLDQLFEPVEVAAAAVLDQRTPEIDQPLRRRRRRQAGKPLAHHQRHGFLDRRIGAVGHLVELAAMEAVVEHGGQVLGHARHAPRADRLDARLLDRIEQRARGLAAGSELAMDRCIVAGELERDRVGMPAHDGGFGRA